MESGLRRNARSRKRDSPRSAKRVGRRLDALGSSARHVVANSGRGKLYRARSRSGENRRSPGRVRRALVGLDADRALRRRLRADVSKRRRSSRRAFGQPGRPSRAPLLRVRLYDRNPASRRFHSAQTQVANYVCFLRRLASCDARRFGSRACRRPQVRRKSKSAEPGRRPPRAPRPNFFDANIKLVRPRRDRRNRVRSRRNLVVQRQNQRSRRNRRNPKRRDQESNRRFNRVRKSRD